MRGVGRFGDTLQATALVNKAFLDWEEHTSLPIPADLENRSTFYQACAMAMRNILRDHWEKQKAQKRGGGRRVLSLEGVDAAASTASGRDPCPFLDLDEALDRLKERNERWFHVVTYRHFSGRSIRETAELLGVSEATVRKDWVLARAWLYGEISRGNGGADEGRPVCG